MALSRFTRGAIVVFVAFMVAFAFLFALDQFEPVPQDPRELPQVKKWCGDHPNRAYCRAKR